MSISGDGSLCTGVAVPPIGVGSIGGECIDFSENGDPV